LKKEEAKKEDGLKELCSPNFILLSLPTGRQAMREGRGRDYKSWMRFDLPDNVKINLKYRLHKSREIRHERI
jgi:hypothetical protein